MSAVATLEDVRAAYDAGMAAAAAHMIHGAQLVNPHRGGRRSRYWRRGAERTVEALRRVMELQP